MDKKKNNLWSKPWVKRAVKYFAVFIVVVLLLDYLIFPWYVHSSIVVVPKVQGMSIEQATAKLESLGLNVQVGGTVYENNQEKGTILRQRPFPNDEVKKGRTVYVFVSGGKPVAKVPSLVGLSINQAKFQLNKNELKIGEITYVPSSVDEGKVVSQEHLAGSTITQGTKVSIQVSAGLEKGTIPVPDLSRMSMSEAEKILKDLSLEVGKIEYKGTTDFLPGTVIDQNPSPGKKLNAGDKVDIIISKDIQPSQD